MEQQNIDLMASKRQTMTNASQDDEWNVIKKGKKVKVVKDIKMELTSSDVPDAKKDKTEEIKIELPKAEVVPAPEPLKKSPPAPVKTKKSKNKSKKKKSHLAVKQDGFEIIEPEFNQAPAADADEEASPEMSEEEEEIPEVVENVVLNAVEEKIETVVAVEQEIVAENVAQPEVAAPKAKDLVKVDDDDIIDISDEDICCKVNLALELASIQEVEHMVEEKKEVEAKKLEIIVEKPETVDKKSEIQENLDVQKVEAEAEVKVNQEDLQVIQPARKTPEAEPLTQVEEPEVQAKKETKTTLLDPFHDKDYFNDRTNIAALERDLMENLRLLDDDIELKSPIINPLHDFPITSAVQKWLQAKQHESFDSLFHVQNFKKLSELYDDDEDAETESDISEKEVKSETDSDYASDFQAKANGGSPTCSTHAKASSKCNKLIAKESFCALM